MSDRSGGYSKDLSGTVKSPSSRGTSKTRVKNPLRRNYDSKHGKMGDDCSRALTHKQPPMK